MKSPKKPLDLVVKLGLGTLIGSFLLIGIGMFLSRPDRTIPPYSIGSQAGTIVAVHLPSWTSDPEIEKLIHRFRKVAGETRDFASMKIRPTTPDDPNGRYQRMTIYIFSSAKWAEPEALDRYVSLSSDEEKPTPFKKEFEASVRGGFSLETHKVKGWIGPINEPKFGAEIGKVRWLFEENLA